jgi:hypothetical protein
VGSRHGAQVNRLSVFAISQCAISLVITKTVFHANDNPDALLSAHHWKRREAGKWIAGQRSFDLPEISENNTKSQSNKEQ